MNNSSEVASCSYDDILYPSQPFRSTHPDRLYSMAKLFSLDSPLPDTASILELGCASGGNIIPLAVQMPNARIIGVDLSSKQIAVGQATLDALQLKNVQLIAHDFQEIDESFGQFDYILCHGVFSWVHPVVQERILQICQKQLSPNGVAYISYNAYPGWFMRGMIREMMLYQVANLSDPKDKIQQARAVLSFLDESTKEQNTLYSQVLRQELELLAKHPDSYLFHEHLEENNRPMFFYQFMEMAKEHHLQFLGESVLANMVTSNLPPKSRELLATLTSDFYSQSQYIDFVSNRMFRQSLLCHSDRKLNRNLSSTRIKGGYFAGNIRAEDPSLANDLSGEIEVAFKSPNGFRIQTKDTIVKAMVFTLSETWPGSLTTSQISASVEKKLSATTEIGESERISIANLVNTGLLHLVLRGDIELRFLPDRFTVGISDKPMVSPLVRFQAKQRSSLTTLAHTVFNADPLTLSLLPVFDGTWTKEMIADFIAARIASKELNVHLEGNIGLNSSEVLDQILDQLRLSALLVG